jgi:hypothetical protein
MIVKLKSKPHNAGNAQGFLPGNNDHISQSKAILSLRYLKTKVDYLKLFTRLHETNVSIKRVFYFNLFLAAHSTL